MIKTTSSTINALLILSCTGLLTSCGFWKNDPPSPPAAPTVALPDTSDTPTKPLLAPTTRTLEFTVDTERTTGTIDLSLDPKGNLLDLRKARGIAPLKGRVIVKITEDPNTQKRKISIQDISLTNTTAYDMDFTWGALVGNININIPKGVLRIIPNELTGTSLIDPQHTFILPQSYFTVLGHSQVKGSGLVLAKAVENKKANLTMKKTEPVTLQGSIKMEGSKATLHIPRAVLRDQFDLDGTQLGLIFTADITATAQNL